jgi:DNA-binding NarL/FixJ family response regulator
MKRLRIILVDDHVLILDAIKRMLEPEFTVVGTFADGQSVLQEAPALEPDVIVLDISMPLMNGLNAGERLKQILPETKLVYLTMNEDPDLAADAFQLGASGYVLKSSAPSELTHAIREAAEGRSYITPLMTTAMVDNISDENKTSRKPNKLTLRQKEVLQLLAEGRSMKEVAFMLNVSPRTVAFHKYSMMQHLRVKSSAELIQFAVRRSIVAA